MGTYNRGRPPKYDPFSNNGRKPPKSPGEYRIKDSSNSTKYLGITNDLDRRMKEHKKSGKLSEGDKFEWMAAKKTASYDDIRDHERVKIKQKNPYANKRQGGAGPNPKIMNYYDISSNIPVGNSEPKKKGCYIATSVYGSYDCPEVWTLRRFRDYTLAKTWFGRTFIQIYYFTSPFLVNRFGNDNWFRSYFKRRLDRMVSILNAKGVSNTPYSD